MKSGMFEGAWKIGTVMGIPIRLHFSWFIIFGLITRNGIARYIQVLGR